MTKKTLFITYKAPSAILEGGGQGAQKNYNTICQIVGKENVAMYYVHDESQKTSVWRYLISGILTVFNYYYGLTPWRVRKIVQMAQPFDFVFIDRTLFGIIAKKLRKSNFHGKIISYFHNVEKIYIDAKLSPKMPFRRFLINCADVNDRYSCEYSDTIIALNQRDANILEKNYSRPIDYIVPVCLPDKLSGQDTPPTDMMTPSSRLSCLFLGAYFGPNNDGVLWFVKNVLPKVDVHLKIVGRGMNKLKKENECLSTVEVYSDVPDLDPFMKEADVMILPIFSGSGMKVKTCESLMYGKNIIGTSEAFEGYNMDYSKVGALCNTTEEFITAINDFLQNPRKKFNAYSRELYLAHYSYETTKNIFAEVFK